MPTVIELKESRAGIWERMKQLVDGAEAENRDLTAEEQTNWDKANQDIAELDKRVERQEKLERQPAPAQRQTAMLGLQTGTALRATPEYANAFGKWLRCRRESDLDGESRDLL